MKRNKKMPPLMQRAIRDGVLKDTSLLMCIGDEE